MTDSCWTFRCSINERGNGTTATCGKSGDYDLSGRSTSKRSNDVIHKLINCVFCDVGMTSLNRFQLLKLTEIKLRHNIVTFNRIVYWRSLFLRTFFFLLFLLMNFILKYFLISDASRSKLIWFFILIIFLYRCYFIKQYSFNLQLK